ncbi:MAG: carbonic anhydrase, partial [Negativicutes bacterium]|nr:carbonic anhydrase [Negativicutes bacterium]
MRSWTAGVRMVLTSVLVTGLLSALAGTVSAGDELAVAADDARQRLAEGNARYVAGKSTVVDYGSERLATAKGQHPFAVVVSCSDSRVPPEIVFDCGIGDLFVIRTAGEVVEDVEMGSIEYAVNHLGVKLVVVLGHTECGAVKA